MISFRDKLRGLKQRHPYLWSWRGFTVAIAVILVVLTIRSWIGWQGEDGAGVTEGLPQAQLTAQALANFHEAQALLAGAVRIEEDLILLQLHLGEDLPPIDLLREDLVRCRKFLNHYDVLSNANWQEQTLVRALSTEARSQLRDRVAEILLWSVQAYEFLAQRATREAARRDLLGKAWEMNGRAESCYPKDDIPRVVIAQRASLAEVSGKTAEAKELRSRAGRMLAVKAIDFFHAAFELLGRHRVREALDVLTKEAVPREPLTYQVQLLRAVCLHNLAEYARDPQRYEEAAGAYSTCVALQPTFASSRLERGWMYLKSGRPGHVDLARLDAAMILQEQPASPFARLLRSRVLQRQVDEKCRGIDSSPARMDEACRKLLRAAIDDLSVALETLPLEPVLYASRSKAKKLIGDEQGSREDSAKVIAVKPATAEGWGSRGAYRLKELEKKETQSPALEEVLADFDRALELDSGCLTALYGKARALAAAADRGKEAVTALDALIRDYPDFFDARADRGVLLARQGQRQSARADARLIVEQEPLPRRYYQAARIYAAMNPGSAMDQDAALKLLAMALQGGYGWERLEGRDFTALRDRAEFKDLQRGAAILRRTQK